MTRQGCAAACVVSALWGAALCGWLLNARGPLLIGSALACVPYAWFFRGTLAEGVTRAGLLCCVAVAALPFFLSDALLSDDVYRHLFEGRVVLAGRNPFSTPPLDPSLFFLRDADWQRINHKQIATVYPALMQGVFALLSLARSMYAFKALALAIHLGLTALLHHLRGPRAAWLLGLNPLLLCEGPLSGHHDALIGMLVLVAVVGLEQQRLGGWIAMVLASGLKVVGLVVALTQLRARPRAASGTMILGVLLIVPSFALSGSAVSGSTHFAHRWQSGTGPYALVESGVEATMQALGVRAHIRFRPAPEVPSIANPTATFASVYRGSIQRRDLARFITRVLILAMTVAFAIWSGARFAAGHAIMLSLWWTLLFSPQFHPWYWLWVAPLGCFLGRPAPLVATPLLLAIYAGLDSWLLARQSFGGFAWVQILLAALFIWELRAACRAPEQSATPSFVRLRT